MKKSLFVICIFLMFFSAFNSVAKLKKSKPNPPHAVARGFSNLMFGWLEVPRGIIYENSRIPVVGLVVGPIKGALLTTWRVLAGTVDVVGMGLTREGLYSDDILPEFVWDAPWISPCGEDVVNVKTLNTSPCLNEEMVTEENTQKKYRAVKIKKINRGFNPEKIKKSGCSKRQTTHKRDKEKYKTTVLCWKSPVKSSNTKIQKKRRYVKNNSETPVPFNLDSDDEFLEALDQIKHHVKNIEHKAQMISNGQ